MLKLATNLLLALFLTGAALAQQAQSAPPPPPAPTPVTDEPAPPPPAPDSSRPDPAANGVEAPQTLSRAASGAYDRRDTLPSVNVYLPEGQASIRLRKLIRNVLFESQIDYRFVNGDISTFLRYKYYARTFTYRLGVFDQISFLNLGSHSRAEFERVRGGLLLFEFPRNYNHRYYWLLQDDRLTFGDTTVVDNRKNNIYTKVAYQYGTQLDERLNAIAGETRGRITPVLTAFRDLGPQRFSLAAAVTQSAQVQTGDYKYTKVEAEALRRTDISETSFLVTRLHAGIFANRGTIIPAPVPVDEDGDGTLDLPPRSAFYTIPRYELFDLSGREGLRSLRDLDETEGTHEAHLTNELFVPIFRNRDFHTWLARWNTLYGIAYVGAGGIGFEAREAFRSSNAVVDAGLGAEASIGVRDFEVILSILYAHTVHAPASLEHGKVSFSIRTVR